MPQPDTVPLEKSTTGAREYDLFESAKTCAHMPWTSVFTNLTNSVAVSPPGGVLDGSAVGAGSRLGVSPLEPSPAPPHWVISEEEHDNEQEHRCRAAAGLAERQASARGMPPSPPDPDCPRRSSIPPEPSTFFQRIAGA